MSILQVKTVSSETPELGCRGVRETGKETNDSYRRRLEKSRDTLNDKAGKRNQEKQDKKRDGKPTQKIHSEKSQKTARDSQDATQVP